jgi:3-oxoacyl-[acyl-carrier-protein] synthase II
VAAVVGTGLGEQASVEAWALGRTDPPAADRPFPATQDFGDVVRRAVPGVEDVITLSGACSAGGHALAVAQDLVDLGEADAVVAAGVDAMSRAMLAMIGLVGGRATAQVRPFDADRTGVLLGEGAAAVVVVPGGGRAVPSAGAGSSPWGRLLATGLSCDAHHETAPSVEGIERAMTDALARAGREPAEVRAVVAHGTGTALNDPAECRALREVVVDGGGAPLVTATKGAVGHTSGAAALVNVDVALRAVAARRLPPVAGLRVPLPEGAGLRFVVGEPLDWDGGLVQCHAFGFGGVNSVTLVAPA